MWNIFKLLEGLVGFGKFRLAEMKSRPSAELDFSDSATSDPNKKSALNTLKQTLIHYLSSGIQVQPKTMLEIPGW